MQRLQKVQKAQQVHAKDAINVKNASISDFKQVRLKVGQNESRSEYKQVKMVGLIENSSD